MFLVASNYFPSWSGGTSKPYTQLSGVYIEDDDHIGLDFISYTVGGVNDCVSLTLEVISSEDVYLYEYQFYDLSGEEILPLELDNYEGIVKFDVIIVNFFYPDDILEYEFELDCSNRVSEYDDVDKKLYSTNPYFYSFASNQFLYHWLRFPYYKESHYIDSNIENYLDYFRFNVDDECDLSFVLELEYKDILYSIDLGYIKKEKHLHLYTIKQYYFNPMLDRLEIESNGDNYFVSNLKFPIKEIVKLKLNIIGDIEYVLSMDISPLVDLFGSCEEAQYCFVIR